jgi:hypothetical protein
VLEWALAWGSAEAPDSARATEMAMGSARATEMAMDSTTEAASAWESSPRLELASTPGPPRLALRRSH